MKGQIQYILTIALVLVLVLSPVSPVSAAVNTKIIDNPVPGDYLSMAESSQQGRVVQEKYTVSSGNHAGLEKYIYVYLPAGYDDTNHMRHRDKYDIFYFMHGLGGTAYELLGNRFNGGQIKNMIDHMIAEEKIEPIIIVAVTWNTNAGLSEPNSSVISSQGGDAERQAFHTEFENDVMPLIETKYRTYAGLATESPEETETSERLDSSFGVSPIDMEYALKDSRDHRGFGGFSYGAHTTWYQLRSDVDYIKYFSPMSGGLNNLYNEIMGHRHDYELCCVTGTADVTSGQCDSIMGLYSPDDAAKVNYYKINGAAHSYTGYSQYLYTALLEFYGSGIPAESVKDNISNGNSAGETTAGGGSGSTPAGESQTDDSTTTPSDTNGGGTSEAPSNEPVSTEPIVEEEGRKEDTVTKKKGATTFTIKLSKPSIKVKTLRKKKQTCTIKIIHLSKGSSKPTYKIKSVSKGMIRYVSVNRSGKVTIKKGCKKCKIKVIVTSKENQNRKKHTKIATITVK